MIAWYCLQTAPRCEMFLHKQLRAKGYDTIHLWYPRMIRHARQVTEICMPLFEQYLFVGIGEDQDFAYVRDRREVVGFVTSPGGQREVHLQWIAFMRSFMADNSGLVRPEIIEEFGLAAPKGKANRAFFARGVLLRIIDGPFIGIGPAVVDLDDGDIFRVLIKMLGRHTRVELDPAHVEPLHPAGGVSPSVGKDAA